MKIILTKEDMNSIVEFVNSTKNVRVGETYRQIFVDNNFPEIEVTNVKFGNEICKCVNISNRVSNFGFRMLLTNVDNIMALSKIKPSLGNFNEYRKIGTRILDSFKESMKGF